MENVLKQLPSDVAVTHLRPVAFYYNLYNFLDMIKGKGFLESIVGNIFTLRYYGLNALLQDKKGIMVSNYGAADKVPWVSPIDIAASIAEEITSPMKGRNVRYVAGEEITCNEVASILGTAVNKTYLKCAVISDKQMFNGMRKSGVPVSLAEDLTEMNASMHSGLLFKDSNRNKPAVMGK